MMRKRREVQGVGLTKEEWKTVGKYTLKGMKWMGRKAKSGVGSYQGWLRKKQSIYD